MIKRKQLSKKDKVIEFIKDLIVLFAFSLSAFWIVITGVYLIPQISNSNGHILTPFFYSLGTLSLSVIVMYVGLKYLNLLGPDEIIKKEAKKK